MQDKFVVIAKQQILMGNSIRLILNFSLEGGQLSLPVDDECFRKIGVGDTVEFKIGMVERYSDKPVVAN